MLDSTDSLPNLVDLSNRVAVVTGGAGILGSIYCRALVEAGARVIVADLYQASCDKLAMEINSASKRGVTGLAVDLSDEQSVKRWGNKILEEFESVDILVNNAASKSPNFFEPLESFPLEDWNKVMAVNVAGMFLAIRELGPSMVARGKGSIINVSSIYGLVGPDQRIYEGSLYQKLGGTINTPLVYSASKGAVIAMTKYLAAYWGPKGVRTNTLSPGGVISGQNDEFIKRYSERVPLGRMARAEEMIGALLFLASDASSYINGQNVIVDGGWTAW